ncbi:MAG TPA: hypothetical protein VLX92_02210 [Kofleriaceae bacterium]|nr:hypothetical protein [Kofleriaceae bacterium]
MWWRRARYVLALVGLCALATVPIAKRGCTAKARAREADQLLDYLGDRVADAVTATGKVPPAPAGPTPAQGCCDQGGACAPDAATWDTPGWRALGFSIDGDYRYTYQYLPDPDGAGATVRATADLDCTGATSTVELHLAVKDRAVQRTWTRK